MPADTQQPGAVPEIVAPATFSQDFLDRLSAQAELIEEASRTVSERILDDGTVSKQAPPSKRRAIMFFGLTDINGT